VGGQPRQQPLASALRQRVLGYSGYVQNLRGDRAIAIKVRAAGAILNQALSWECRQLVSQRGDDELPQRGAVPDQGNRQIDLIGSAYRSSQVRQKRIRRPAGGQEPAQAASVLPSSVFSQRSDPPPGRRSPVVQVSTGTRPGTCSTGPPDPTADNSACRLRCMVSQENSATLSGTRDRRSWRCVPH